jgi:ribonuclease Z
LGTGTPINPHRFQSAVLVEIGDSKLLFDAGRGTVHQMYQAGVEIHRVNPIFITHHHFDHINDLFDVVVSSAMAGRDYDLEIYGPCGTTKIVRALLEQVYAQDIRFRIEEAKDIRRRGGSWGERPEAIVMVEAKDVGPGLVAETDQWKVSSDYVLHGDFPQAPDFEWCCLGYRIEAEGKVITISGDTVPCESIIELAKDADLLVQCCHLPKRLVIDTAMRYLTTSILPSSGQVGLIAAKAGVKRMVITHLGATITPTDFPEIRDDIHQDYQGEVLLGQDLLAIEV